MALDDFLETEVAVAVAATAALVSPQVRGMLRRGAVYGLAGLLTAGAKLSSFAPGARHTASSAAARAQEATPQPHTDAEGEGGAS